MRHPTAFGTALAITVVVVLSFRGYAQMPGEWDNLLVSPYDYFYRTLLMFFAGADWSLGVNIPLELEIARFLAPFVTAFTLVALFAKDTVTRVKNAVQKYRKNHIVVMGAGRTANLFVRSCLREGIRPVVIEADDQALGVTELRQLGVAVLIGDALNEDMMFQAGVARSKAVVALCGSDGTNIEISLTVRQFLDRHSGNCRSKIIVGVSDLTMLTRLQSYSKFIAETQAFEMSMFNLFECAARRVILNHPPGLYADIAAAEGVHIAILGFGHMGRSILEAALQLTHYPGAKPVKISILDQRAEEIRYSLENQRPSLFSQSGRPPPICKLEFIPAVFDGTCLPKGIEPKIFETVTQVFVCFEDPGLTTNVALSLRNLFLKHPKLNAPLHLRMSSSTGTSRMLRSNTGAAEIPDGLYPFGMLNEIVTYDTLINNNLDMMAKAYHQRYLTGLKGEALTKPAARPWENLPEIYRRGNRMLADHTDVKLQMIGAERVPGRSRKIGKSIDGFLDKHLEILAEAEHMRWNAEKILAGWRWGEKRIEEARIHNNLTSWNDLPDELTRKYDRDFVEEIPEVVSKTTGEVIARRCLIGVTGHRPGERLDPTSKELRVAVTEVLQDIKKRYDGMEEPYTFVVMSSLATGADQLVAELAAETLGAKIEAPLPLPYRLYKEDFNGAELAEFTKIVGRTSRYFEMPMVFGGLDDMALIHKEEHFGREARNKQYALAGAYIAQRCHEMVALWDGEEGNGPGGTADVVRWRQSNSVPDEYQFPSIFRQSPGSARLYVIPPNSPGNWHFDDER